MAVVLKKTYPQGCKNISGTCEPLIYIDSINKDNFILEMYNIAIRYIRENVEYIKEPTIKRIKHMAKDENDIYYNKSNGYWIVSDEKEKIVSLYHKKTTIGLIYNSIQVDKIFELTCKECPKIVPQVFKKASLFDDFSSELSDRVLKYRERSDVFI